jgi:anaerobic selenocysteine-containing dehydrogenase
MAADMRGRLREEFLAEFPFAKLERLTQRELEAAGRLDRPLIAAPGDRGYRPIEWDEAMERVIAAMRAIEPARSFYYASGRSSNEAGFLLQLLARLAGTNNVHDCSFFCHNASGVGLKSAIGSGAGTIALEDLDRCDCLVIAGGNPASNHPRLMRTVVDLGRRGGSTIVVNPIRETGLVVFRVPSDMRSLLFGSRIADLYVQPHIGSDAALFTGVAKAILEAGAEDRRFIEAATEGFDAWSEAVRATTWTDLERASGVDAAAMQAIAERLRGAKRPVFA